jgi:hypothetical protein
MNSKSTVMKKITALAIIAICFSSCFNNYFKVKTETEWKQDHLQLLQDTSKRIVIHFRDVLGEMVDPVFSSEQITGNLKTYSVIADSYVNPDTENKQNFKYKYRNRKALFSELHIYVNEDYPAQKNYTVSSSNFVKSNIYYPNKGLSIFSHVLGATIIAGVIGMLAAAAVVSATSYMVGAMAMSFNCPQAYIEITPGQYQFIGGLFTGAVRQDLQRTEMIPLTGLSDSSDTVRIRIKGMQDETQFIDHVTVKEVMHPEGTEVVGNRHGDLFIIRHLKMPNEVKAGEMTDRSKTLLFRDGQSYGFHITDSTDNSNIQLKFSRKEGDKKAVLVARMKNSIWGGYINNELRKSDTNPLAIQAGNNSTMTNSAMKISLMTRNGWKTVDHFPPAGNTAVKDLAMEIDLSEVDGKDVLVNMEAPYRFWDVDHVGLSYEIIRPSDVSNLCRVSATINKNEFSGSIGSEDGLYLALENTDQLELEYTKPPRTTTRGSITTYVLVAGGYYHQKSQSNIPQVSQPPRFSDPFSLNQYSIARYKELGLEY